MSTAPALGAVDPSADPAGADVEAALGAAVPPGVEQAANKIADAARRPDQRVRVRVVDKGCSSRSMRGHSVRGDSRGPSMALPTPD
jgi:hypothetical protein